MHQYCDVDCCAHHFGRTVMTIGGEAKPSSRTGTATWQRGFPTLWLRTTAALFERHLHAPTLMALRRSQLTCGWVPATRQLQTSIALRAPTEASAEALRGARALDERGGARRSADAKTPLGPPPVKGPSRTRDATSEGSRPPHRLPQGGITVYTFDVSFVHLSTGCALLSGQTRCEVLEKNA